MTGLVININLRQIGLQVWLKWRSVVGSKPIYIGVLISSTWHPKWSIRQSQILKKHPKFYQSAVFWSKFVRNVLFHANQEIKIQIEEKSNGNIHCHSLNDVGINLIRMCMFLSDFVTNIHLVGIYSGLLSVPCISSLESAIQMEEIVYRVHNWHIDQKINNFEVGNVGIKKRRQGTDEQHTPLWFCLRNHKISSTEIQWHWLNTRKNTGLIWGRIKI